MAKQQIIDNGFKIEDAGQIAPYGRVAQSWAKVETELKKFTNAETFNKKVQTESEEFIKYFGFKGIEFGNWMNQADRLEFIYGAAHSLEVMRKFLGVPAKYIGLGGELAIAFGARGIPMAAAHYEPRHRVINITKPHGNYGSLFHEYAHAVDNIVYQTIRQKHSPNLPNLGFVSGGRTGSKGIDLDRLQRNDLIGLMENIFASTYWNMDGTKKKWLVDFLNSKEGKSEYYNRRTEMFARFSEVWCHQVADKVGTKNAMLVKEKYDRVFYPPNNVISNLFDEFKQFYTISLNFLNGNGSYKIDVNMPTPKTDEPKEQPKKKKIKLKRVAKKEEKPSTKNKSAEMIKEAKRLGKEFANKWVSGEIKFKSEKSIPSPSSDKELMKMIAGREIGETPPGEASSSDIMKAWLSTFRAEVERLNKEKPKTEKKATTSSKTLETAEQMGKDGFIKWFKAVESGKPMERPNPYISEEMVKLFKRQDAKAMDIINAYDKGFIGEVDKLAKATNSSRDQVLKSIQQQITKAKETPKPPTKSEAVTGKKEKKTERKAKLKTTKPPKKSEAGGKAEDDDYWDNYAEEQGYNEEEEGKEPKPINKRNTKAYWDYIRATSLELAKHDKKLLDHFAKMKISEWKHLAPISMIDFYLDEYKGEKFNILSKVKSKFDEPEDAIADIITYAMLGKNASKFNYFSKSLDSFYNQFNTTFDVYEFYNKNYGTITAPKIKNVDLNNIKAVKNNPNLKYVLPFLSKDNFRPAMTGIYFNNGFMAATDSYKLLKRKTNYAKEYEGKIIAPEGYEINEKYPAYNSVIPTSAKFTRIINVDEFRNKLIFPIRYLKSIRQLFIFEIGTLTVGVNWQYFIECLNYYKSIGVNELKISSQKEVNKPLILTSSDENINQYTDLVLLMPIKIDSNDINNPSGEVFSESKTADKGLSDKYRRSERRQKKDKQTYAKSRKNRTTTKYESEKLADKPKKTKVKKLTIKEVKLHAQAIKDRGTTGQKAWQRLESFMRGFDNVTEMWGELSIHRGITYTPLSKILPSDYFYSNTSGLSDNPKQLKKKVRLTFLDRFFGVTS